MRPAKRPAKRKGYLVLSIMAFVLSVYAFAGVLPGKGINYLPPWYGWVLIAIGFMKLYWYLTSDRYLMAGEHRAAGLTGGDVQRHVNRFFSAIHLVLLLFCSLIIYLNNP